MIESVALIAGIIGIVFSALTMVVLFLLKKNVTDILRKDALIFDKNFEIKQKALVESLNIVDEVLAKGKSICSNASFLDRSKKCYNELICVLNNTKLADAFYDIALNPNYIVTMDKVHIYKMLSRKDLGFKISKLEYNTTNEQPEVSTYNTAPQPVQPVTPAAEEKPTKIINTTTPPAQNSQPRPVQQTRPNSATAPRPMPRPNPATKPIARPAQNPGNSEPKS